MNCQAPFPDDDPMLPSQHPQFGECRHCGYEHRLDLGCAMAEAERSSAMLGWVVMIVLGVAGVVVALSIAWVIWRGHG